VREEWEMSEESQARFVRQMTVEFVEVKFAAILRAIDARPGFSFLTMPAHTKFRMAP
jgi:hypothetical protein